MSMSSVGSFYDIVEKNSLGKDVSFEKFKGKVLIRAMSSLYTYAVSDNTTFLSDNQVVYGVNVASRCGYTAEGYSLLSRIAALKDSGVEVAIFPCNQFGAQEPGTDEEINTFCAVKGVKDANVFTKGDVNGANTR